MYRQAQELEEQQLKLYEYINLFRQFGISENILNEFAQRIGLPDAQLPFILKK